MKQEASREAGKAKLEVNSEKCDAIIKGNDSVPMFDATPLPKIASKVCISKFL